MKLICRLYLPGEGNLKLFGVEAADWNEASSALDFQTEREVQDADYVYCMDHDRVAEEGTPMGLLGRFWELYESQRRGGGTGVEEDCSGA